jgi:3-phenylpropionate/trans-cinnamate dioxygenase ferredoxin subunit/anthranilate 1,2-dioxygenase ferredoxin subunit
VTLLAAAALDAIPADRPLRVELGGTALALCRVGDAVYACGDMCAHRGAPLSEGKLSGTRLACPWHGWMYDVRTGQCTFPGRGAAVPSYPARIESGQVWVELP